MGAVASGPWGLSSWHIQQHCARPVWPRRLLGPPLSFREGGLNPDISASLRLGLGAPQCTRGQHIKPKKKLLCPSAPTDLASSLRSTLTSSVAMECETRLRQLGLGEDMPNKACSEGSQKSARVTSFYCQQCPCSRGQDHAQGTSDPRGPISPNLPMSSRGPRHPLLGPPLCCGSTPSQRAATSHKGLFKFKLIKIK